MRDFNLANYKGYVKNIKHPKGTAEWLKEFVRFAKEHYKLVKQYKLTIADFYWLQHTAIYLGMGGSMGTIQESVANFCRKNGFCVEEHDVGWIIKETK